MSAQERHELACLAYLRIVFWGAGAFRFDRIATAAERVYLGMRNGL